MRPASTANGTSTHNHRLHSSAPSTRRPSTSTVRGPKKQPSRDSTRSDARRLHGTRPHPHATTITVVEPIREKLEPPQKTKRSKALQVLGDGIGFVCYMLCMCCVLSGEQRPDAKKHKGYYTQYDDICEFGGTRVRKVDSTGTASVGSKARSGRVEMVR